MESELVLSSLCDCHVLQVVRDRSLKGLGGCGRIRLAIWKWNIWVENVLRERLADKLWQWPQ